MSENREWKDIELGQDEYKTEPRPGEPFFGENAGVFVVMGGGAVLLIIALHLWIIPWLLTGFDYIGLPR